MEPTSLIYLPDGPVLDPAAVAAINPAGSASRYFHYRLKGDPVAYAIEAESPEHAIELRAYMVACKELATAVVVKFDDADVHREMTDLHLHLPMTAAADRKRLDRISGDLRRRWSTVRKRLANPPPEAFSKPEAESRAVDVLFEPLWLTAEKGATQERLSHCISWNDALESARRAMVAAGDGPRRVDGGEVPQDDDDRPAPGYDYALAEETRSAALRVNDGLGQVGQNHKPDDHG